MDGIKRDWAVYQCEDCGYRAQDTLEPSDTFDEDD